MPLKTLVTKSSKKENQFPRLMINKVFRNGKNNDRIVWLITGVHSEFPLVLCGVALTDGELFKTGETSDDLSSTSLQDFYGTITLSN